MFLHSSHSTHYYWPLPMSTNPQWHSVACTKTSIPIPASHTREMRMATFISFLTSKAKTKIQTGMNSAEGENTLNINFWSHNSLPNSQYLNTETFWGVPTRLSSLPTRQKDLVLSVVLYIIWANNVAHSIQKVRID